MPSLRLCAVLGAAVVALHACGGDPATPDVPAVVSVRAGGSTAIASGTSSQLSATYTDTRGRAVSNATFTWSTSDAAVATVSQTGLVTGARAGSATITATTSGTAGSLTITVTPGAAARLELATQPGGAASGLPLTTQPVVEVRDQAGNLVSNATANITASAVGSGSITGTLSVAAQQGVARFTDLALLGQVGGRTILFSSPGLQPVTSNVFELAAGPPASLTYEGAPPRLRSGIPAGIGLSAISAQLRDAEGNPAPVANRRVTVTVTGGVGATQLRGDTVLTNAQGRANFTALTLTGLAGVRVLRFSVPELTNAATASVTLLGGRPARLAIDRDLPSTVEDRVAITPAPVVRLLDSLGNSAPEGGVFVRATLAGGAGTLTGNSITTDSSGRAIFPALTVTDGAGPRTVQFSADGVSGVTSRPITVTALDTTTQPAAITTAASASDTTVRVIELGSITATAQPFLQARNAQGLPMGIGGVRWFARDPSRATVSANGTITGALPGRTFVVAQASRTPSVADSVLVFVPRNATGPILRTTLSTYRIATDTFSIIVEVIPRDGQPLSAIDFSIAWPGADAFTFSPFTVQSFAALRSGVVVQQVDLQENLRVTWASATPVNGPIQLLRLNARVNRRNVGNQVLLTLNQLLRGDLVNVTAQTSVYNPVVIIP